MWKLVTSVSLLVTAQALLKWSSGRGIDLGIIAMAAGTGLFFVWIYEKVFEK